MIMVFRIIILSVFICTLLVYFRVTIHATLAHFDQEHYFNMSVESAFGIINKDYHYGFEDIRSLLLQDSRPDILTRLIQFPRQLRGKYTAFKANMRLTSRIFKFMVIEEIEWKTRAGSENAMDTALMTGFLWSFKGMIISSISSKTKLQRLVLSNEPDFNKPGIHSYLVCILKMRIVHIIIIASYILAIKVRGYFNGYSRRKN
ncbi:MAG TPA: DUF2953 domain-containing protein [Syntrophomonadaceae bacterium]|nr:DUF2953 domain-containing protein [Syntrophomonadaceae bacterium]